MEVKRCYSSYEPHVTSTRQRNSAIHRVYRQINNKDLSYNQVMSTQADTLYGNAEKLEIL